MAAKKAKPKTSKAKKPAPTKSARKPVVARKASAPAKAAPGKAASAAKVARVKSKPAAGAPVAPPAPETILQKPRHVKPLPVQDDAENADSALLTGPRNVQPYIAKRGEQYMSREQLDHFRTILQNWKRDLMEEVDRTVSHMKDEAANFPDPNDRATQEEEFSLELRTRDRERKLIRKIDEALARIEDGSYGYCLETGEPIGIKRLEARPVATLSIEAQERRERREKQYGDRDDRYR
jgi:DnaK suppressor protein